MKKHEIIFTTIKVPLDFLIIFVSFFLARKIRLITDFIPSLNLPVQTIDTNSLIFYATISAIISIFLFISHWIYSSKISNSKIKEVVDIIRYSIYSFLFLSVFIYFTKWFLWNITEIPRLIIIFSYFIWVIWIILWRILLNNIQYYLISIKKIKPRKIAIINNQSYTKIKEIIDDIKNANIYDLVGYVNKSEIKKENNIKFIWDIKKLKKIIEKKQIDEIIYIDSDFNKKELFNIWELTKFFWVRYRYITNSFDITSSNTEISLINNIPTIEIKNTPLESVWWRFFKRIFDIILSLMLLIIFSPLMVIVAILIKIEDPKWPVIYKNRRQWQDFKEFDLYKFRYIKWKYCIKDSYWIENKNDEALKFEEKLIKKSSTRKWPLYKIKNDPRKTKIWNFIEKYSIDELPQFFNSLAWNMSIVWPRPHQPREIKNYKIHQKRVLTIKPWITWMAQVNWREKNNFEDEVKLDIFYIENWNLLLDLKILFKTISTIINR